MTHVLIRTGNVDTDTHTLRGKTVEDEGRRQPIRVRVKASESKEPGLHFDRSLLAPRSVRK